jgi:transposase
MQVNQLRGLLYEFGAELPKGQQRGTQEIPNALAQLDGVLPAMVIEALRQQLERLGELDRDIAEMERGLAGWTKKDAASRRLMDIPGVGLLTATAAVATIGDAGASKSGRESAASLGLVPRQSGTGGRVKLLGISKRRDVFQRIQRDAVVEGRRGRAMVPGRSHLGKKTETRKRSQKRQARDSRIELELT